MNVLQIILIITLQSLRAESRAIRSTNEDCIGNVGGYPLQSGGCLYNIRSNSKTRNEAFSCCNSLDYRVLMPGSNDSDQLSNFRGLFASDDTGPVWTSLSYDVNKGLIHPNGPVTDGFSWKDETAPSENSECIAALYVGLRKYVIYPEDCKTPLGLACVQVEAAAVNSCGADQYILPVFGITCSTVCADKNTTTVPPTSSDVASTTQTTSVGTTPETTVNASTAETANVTFTTESIPVASTTQTAPESSTKQTTFEGSTSDTSTMQTTPKASTVYSTVVSTLPTTTEDSISETPISWPTTEITELPPTTEMPGPTEPTLQTTPSRYSNPVFPSRTITMLAALIAMCFIYGTDVWNCP